MSDSSPSMLKATLIGGGAFGIAAALPFVGALNCACCALVVGGGFTAAWLYSRTCSLAGVEFRPGNGALVGLVAGLFYTVTTSIVSGIIMTIAPPDLEGAMEALEQFNLPPEALEGAESWMSMMGTGFGFVIMACVTLLIAAIFSTVGGLIGGAVFKVERPVPPPPPPPPHSYSGPGPGAFPPQG